MKITNQQFRGLAKFGLINLILLTMVILAPMAAQAGTVTPKVGTQTHQELTGEVILDYLTRWEIRDAKLVDNQISTKIRYKERNYQFNIRILPNDVVIVRIENLLFLPKNHLNFNRVSRHLLMENFRLTVGKFTWDPRDGEVGVEHAIVAHSGIAYDDFVDVMVRLLVTSDRKYAEIMKAMWK
jgi:translation initiation factor IF-1